MRYILETSKLTKVYNNVAVVNLVNMHIPQGKIYGLLGRNGAGKTTLMKMLLGLTFPTYGKIKFGKEGLCNNKEYFKNIGSIIEAPGFYENLTAFDNLRILALLRDIEGDKKINEALKLVGLENEKKKKFKNFSLGMKQRLSIAAAILHSPKFLILDEPINSLDPVGILEVRGLLVKLCKEEGMTILISSHVLSKLLKNQPFI